MIDFAAARKCLKAFDFAILFREHLGWDKHKAQITVIVNGTEYTLTAVAQKRGVIAFVCAEIPDRGVRLKLDHQITKSAREHFVIYTDHNAGLQLWHWVRREPGKPLAGRDHRFNVRQSGDALLQRLDQIAVSIEEEERITLVDVAGGLRAAFDVDRVTRRFYDRFKTEHAVFLKLVKGISVKADLEWYTSLMLNRLMFVYFIQKKGFLDGDVNYLRNRLKRVKALKGKDKFQSFYRYFLLRLFHDGLGKTPAERKLDRSLESLLGTVPYLNGGFFEVHQIEEHNKDIDIPDRAFGQLFDFFDDYAWHLDERPLRADNEINPDVVGYIFEKYINQKQMGAYYTKEDITEYISKNTIVPFLFDVARKKCTIAFEPDSALWALLRDAPDRYIYPAVRHGVVREDGALVPESDLPAFVRKGMHDPKARMHDNRYNLQQAPAGDPIRLVTETWREYGCRRARCLEIREKLRNGEVHEINELITLNLDIWQFARDAIVNAEGPELLRAFWHAIEKVTVLDPTCGSGAFLFAALRILETLYSDCLERMKAFIEESGTGVPPVEQTHGQDAHATYGTDVPSVENGVPPEDTRETLRIRQGAYLPHWTQEGALYAVTFRLGDALPKTVLNAWVQERDDIVATARKLGRPLSRAEEERLHELHSEKVESYLDAGHGACWMKEERIARIVADALSHFDGERYDLLGWCVMPNHVHVVFRPGKGQELSAILHSWKSFTAKEANRALHRKGQFWQEESYDHIIRNEQELNHSLQYILDNPVQAGLKNWKWIQCVCSTETVCGTGVPPVESTANDPPVEQTHGQDAHATRGTGVSPVNLGNGKNHGQDAHATRYKKFSDFRQVLDQVGKHPNERYFILKSIILNNLFGVDIMEEAVEICKLRLFLKLVAQVETAEQIEPLPDIDFNIRAGNTLVGYATADQVRKAFTEVTAGQVKQGMLLMGEAAENYERFEENLLLVEKAFQQFRLQQTTHGGKITLKDKQELRKRLDTLNAELDRYLAAEYGIAADNYRKNGDYENDFAQWKASHEPFHWIVDFYGIMNEGGFDVVIGNPPYVEYSKVRENYTIRNYQTESCGNLYAYVIERCFNILAEKTRMGMIVQLPIVCTDRMIPLQEECLEESKKIWFANFDDRPARLFEGLEHIRATIFLSYKDVGNDCGVFSTTYNRWYSEGRLQLFEDLSFSGISDILVKGAIPKVGEIVAKRLKEKTNGIELLKENFVAVNRRFPAFFHNAPQYWIRAMDRAPYFWNERDGEQISTQVKTLLLASKIDASVVVATLNSSLFYWWFLILSDCRHLNMREIENFPLGYDRMSEVTKLGLSELTHELMANFKQHKVRKECQYKTTGKVAYDEYYPKYSKSILDKIDKVLARHYGFTDEELDFIINYDIKYRMGGADGDDGDDE